MPLQFLLDFTVPFEVGDVVYTDYPSTDQSVGGEIVNRPSLKATISSVKVLFGPGPGGSLVVTDMISQQDIQVDRVLYTLIPDANLFSAFTVEWLVADPSPPQLFTTEEEWMIHRQNQA